MALVTSKSIFASKTFWFNAVVVIATILTEISHLDLPFVNAEWFVTLMALVNIILRYRTKAPVTVQGGDTVKVHE